MVVCNIGLKVVDVRLLAGFTQQVFTASFAQCYAG
jgi:hypothetical protein